MGGKAAVNAQLKLRFFEYIKKKSYKRETQLQINYWQHHFKHKWSHAGSSLLKTRMVRAAIPPSALSDCRAHAGCTD